MSDQAFEKMKEDIDKIRLKVAVGYILESFIPFLDQLSLQTKIDIKTARESILIILKPAMKSLEDKP